MQMHNHNIPMPSCIFVAILINMLNAFTGRYWWVLSTYPFWHSLVFVLCMSFEILKENKKFSKSISFAQTWVFGFVFAIKVCHPNFGMLNFFCSLEHNVMHFNMNETTFESIGEIKYSTQWMTSKYLSFCPCKFSKHTYICAVHCFSKLKIRSNPLAWRMPDSILI